MRTYSLWTIKTQSLLKDASRLAIHTARPKQMLILKVGLSLLPKSTATDGPLCEELARCRTPAKELSTHQSMQSPYRPAQSSCSSLVRFPHEPDPPLNACHICSVSLGLFHASATLGPAALSKTKEPSRAHRQIVKGAGKLIPSGATLHTLGMRIL